MQLEPTIEVGCSDVSEKKQAKALSFTHFLAFLLGLGGWWETDVYPVLVLGGIVLSL